ncbi:ATP-dependent DNA helicase PIF6-like [Brachionus plicatilis]|uniref:ATP-dependent DNA helicase PIF6-like n=1 Tax=Brachionus plicatilis TaxID=10195 RepID=A0A3M7SBL0_BRAPC|nr:ATP-dependent DNA helicase PIF6-like [Brachionus plicatilis]
MLHNLDKEGLIKKVYPTLETIPDPDSLVNSAILCPTNEDVDSINEIATKFLPGETIEYLSTNSIVNDVNTAVLLHS